MKVRELLSSEDKWTKDKLARDKDGNSVWYDSLDTVKWCLMGAISKCYRSEKYKIVRRIEDITNTIISRFNDSHSYEEVMELVRRLDI